MAFDWSAKTHGTICDVSISISTGTKALAIAKQCYMAF
jgi:hypothetical protein